MSDLISAAYDGDVDRCRTLLDAGADVNEREGGHPLGSAAIHLAAESGNLGLVLLLVARGADVSTPSGSGTPLYCAALSGHAELAQYLIQNGADPNAPGDDVMRAPPLHVAAAAGHLAVVVLLIDHGADVGACDPEGYTPLHGAAGTGSVEVARLLLHRGANVNATADTGETVLHFALGDEMRELLLAHGAVETEPPEFIAPQPEYRPTLADLADVLLHDGPADRVAAVDALREITPRAAMATVVEALQDSDAAVRAMAADVLGGMGKVAGPRGGPALRAALDDPVADVRRASAKALRRIGDEDDAPGPASAAADPDVGVL